MQRPLRSAVWIDRASVTLLSFALSFLWFQHRQLSIYLSIALAGMVSLLLIYAIILLSNRNCTRSHNTKKQSHMRYALSMLPYNKALELSAMTLADRYGMILPRRVNSKDAFALAYDKATGTQIAIGLNQDPIKLDFTSIHAFHRLRGLHPAVLLHLAQPSKDAASYAETLSPPLRLLDISPLLPYDAALCEQYPYPRMLNTKKRTTNTLLKADRTQAVRCMFFSYGMIVLYLFTERLSILLPALTLAFFALMCKRQVHKDTLF